MKINCFSQSQSSTYFDVMLNHRLLSVIVMIKKTKYSYGHRLLEHFVHSFIFKNICTQLCLYVHKFEWIFRVIKKLYFHFKYHFSAQSK